MNKNLKSEVCIPIRGLTVAAAKPNPEQPVGK